MIKASLFVTVFAMCVVAHAEPPRCLPAALALSSTPLGLPVPTNTYWPTLSTAPRQHGLAAFWYCKVEGDIRVLEMHSTPQALARAGGLHVLQSHYLSQKDEAWETLDATGHGCVDLAPKAQGIAKRTDCFAVATADGHPKRYLCLNPAVTEWHEARLCKHLLNEMASQWPN